MKAATCIRSSSRCHEILEALFGASRQTGKEGTAKPGDHDCSTQSMKGPVFVSYVLVPLLDVTRFWKRYSGYPAKQGRKEPQNREITTVLPKTLKTVFVSNVLGPLISRCPVTIWGGTHPQAGHALETCTGSATRCYDTYNKPHILPPHGQEEGFVQG